MPHSGQLLLDIIRNVALIGILGYLLSRLPVVRRTFCNYQYRTSDQVILAFIVDDEPLLCDEMKNILESQCGLGQVQACHDGIEALQIIEKERIDLVFLDMQMPGISGIKVARIWASKQNPPIVVFVTAYSEYALTAFGVDALDYVLKPFDEEDIRRVLNKIEKYCGYGRFWIDKELFQ